MPAPATALLLKGVPFYSRCEEEGELCTPTGAAILKYFASEFKDIGGIIVNKIGYGMGTKDFSQANCVRVFMGDYDEATDLIVELACNVDDMSGEEVGFAMEKLMEAGAKDVFYTNIGMKKGRPGIMFHVVCSVNDEEKMIEALFKYTTTIGIREVSKKRYIMHRNIEEINTTLGKVRVKHSYGYGSEKSKYEYEDLAAIANENGLSISEVRELLKGEEDE